MFRLFYILAFTLLVSLYGCKENVTCSSFKAGKFYYYSKDRTKILITRSDSLQVSFNTKNSVEAKYDIHWISPCEYYINAQLPARSPSDTSDLVFAPVVVKAKIISVTDEFSVCQYGEASPPLIHKAPTDTIWIAKSQ